MRKTFQNNRKNSNCYYLSLERFLLYVLRINVIQVGWLVGFFGFVNMQRVCKLSSCWRCRCCWSDVSLLIRLKILGLELGLISKRMKKVFKPWIQTRNRTNSRSYEYCEVNPRHVYIMVIMPIAYDYDELPGSMV